MVQSTGSAGRRHLLRITVGESRPAGSEFWNHFLTWHRRTKISFLDFLRDNHHLVNQRMAHQGGTCSNDRGGWLAENNLGNLRLVTRAGVQMTGGSVISGKTLPFTQTPITVFGALARHCWIGLYLIHNSKKSVNTIWLGKKEIGHLRKTY